MWQKYRNNTYNFALFVFYIRFDHDLDGFLDIEDMKRMMEDLGAPQTHLALKKMIKEVDTDNDDKISFNEVSFLTFQSRGDDPLLLLNYVETSDQSNDDGVMFAVQFLLIYHKAKAGQLEVDGGLHALAKITEVDITEVGVVGAKGFFESKVNTWRLCTCMIYRPCVVHIVPMFSFSLVD